MPALHFWTQRPKRSTPALRSYDGLIFQSRHFHADCWDYQLIQNFITPCTPEKNGMIERLFCRLKEECTCLHRFETFEGQGRPSPRSSVLTARRDRTNQQATCPPACTGFNNTTR